jgi:hypothetical protein
MSNPQDERNRALRKPFDAKGFARRFREACVERGIDPEAGATGYAVVHAVVEQKRAAWRDDGWWLDHNRWLSCPPYRNEVEEEAIWRVFKQAFALMLEAELEHLQRELTAR